MNGSVLCRLTDLPSEAPRPGNVADPVTRRKPQARAGQVVRAHRPAPCALPPQQFIRQAGPGLSRLPPGRGRNGPGPRPRGDPGAVAGHRPLRRTPSWNSASTSARRYRGLPASLRTSGSRPRRAQEATTAEVTRNMDATCLRVSRSSPTRLPASAAATNLRAAGRGPGGARPDGCQRHHVHQVPRYAGMS